MVQDEIPKTVLSQNSDFTDSKTTESVLDEIPKEALSQSRNFTDSRVRLQRCCMTRFQRLSSHRTVILLRKGLDCRDDAL